MEFPFLLPPEYQQWLINKGYFQVDKTEKYKQCPLVEVLGELESDKNELPSYLKIAKRLHESPLLVVEYPTLLELFNEDGEQKLQSNAIRTSLHRARVGGCISYSIYGLGVSVGIESSSITPNQARLLYGVFLSGNQGLNQRDLIGFLRNYSFDKMDSGLRRADFRYISTELSRMRKERGLPLTKGGRISLSN